MNGEIKFRGKRKDNDRFAYGYYLHDADVVIMPCVIYYEGKFIEVHPETVGQYTGLKDKNGVEIYEGDLCQTNNETYGIELQEAGGAYRAVNINKEEREEDVHFLLNCNHFLEIIGNIHQNPELL